MHLQQRFRHDDRQPGPQPHWPVLPRQPASVVIDFDSIDLKGDLTSALLLELRATAANMDNKTTIVFLVICHSTTGVESLRRQITDKRTFAQGFPPSASGKW
jgi:hypothetical protein